MTTYEQISLDIFAPPKNIRDIKCKFAPPLRRYFCEDNWWSKECKGCANYKEDLRNPYLMPDDDMPIKHIQYIEFKTWLYGNFPQFIDKEINTDVWEYSPVNKFTISVSLKWRDEISKGQYISVCWEDRRNGCSGGGYPCDTISEVRERLERIINDTAK